MTTPPLSAQGKRADARPILFSGPMVRAILAGKKTQTRRVLKVQPRMCEPDANGNVYAVWSDKPWPRVKPTMAELLIDIRHRCPYGARGDTLWVRETWRPLGSFRWRPSIHMPRWASRLSLLIADVRVERLHDITDEDAVAEGIPRIPDSELVCHCGTDLIGHGCGDGHSFTPMPEHRYEFSKLWDEVCGTSATNSDWSSNPWVWAVSFERIGGPS